LKSQLPKASQAVDHAVEQSQVLDAMREADVGVERAVSVEEDRGSHHEFDASIG
jgi:hypothetical protein